MARIFLDIETVPAPNHSLITSQKKDEDDQAYNSRLSMSGTTGMIVCIGYAIEDGPVESFYMDRMWLSGDGEGWRADEAALLSKFWEIVANARPVRFVGHNVLDFDLRHIVQRSVVHNIRQYGNISFVRFRNDPIFDTMQEWCKWRGGVKLAELALALGLPSPKTDMDGSGVAKAYAECKFEQISEYCKRDVETTRQVYKRIQGI